MVLRSKSHTLLLVGVDLRDLIANLNVDAMRTKPMPKRMSRGGFAEPPF
jgi:hypothetical protein